MKKLKIFGALAMSTVAICGLVGCDEEAKTYTVTFDSNPAITTDDVVVKYKEGATKLDNVPVPVEKEGFAGVWEAYELNDENITVTATYGNGMQSTPYMVATASQLLTILQFHLSNEYKPTGDPLAKTHFKLIADIDLNDVSVELAGIDLSGKYFNNSLKADGHTVTYEDSTTLAKITSILNING